MPAPAFGYGQRQKGIHQIEIDARTACVFDVVHFRGLLPVVHANNV
ncbi:hypothetical protein OPIT5_13475 [Opitutaceae bacterium TAV5]|nr:hypothetical protein OPIT5_13475 [Opitutaceae bacterium TAV5]